MGKEVGARELAGYEEIVVATGVDPRTPPIPGIERAVSYVDVLNGKVQAGRNVAIVGMGGIGFDVALYLLERDSRAPYDPAAFRGALGDRQYPGTGQAEASDHDAEAPPTRLSAIRWGERQAGCIARSSRATACAC